jgi:hypothetical protein
LLQGTFLLQVLLQTETVEVWRSCRAETVPAQSTPVTSTAKSAVLIFLLMVSSPSYFQLF